MHVNCKLPVLVTILLLVALSARGQDEGVFQKQVELYKDSLAKARGQVNSSKTELGQLKAELEKLKANAKKGAPQDEAVITALTNRINNISSQPVNTLDAYADTSRLVREAYRDEHISYYQSAQKQHDENAKLHTAVIAHQLWALQNQEQAMKNQQSKGQIIFWVVIAVVACGLLFSGIQFYVAVKGAFVKKESTVEKSTAGTAPPPAETKTETTTFEISPLGIKITSSIIGLIILAMSIAFFYLYLHQVFPLNFQKIVEAQ